MDQRDQIERDEAVNNAVRQITTALKKRRTGVVDILVGGFLALWFFEISKFLLLVAWEAMQKAGTV